MDEEYKKLVGKDIVLSAHIDDVDGAEFCYRMMFAREKPIRGISISSMGFKHSSVDHAKIDEIISLLEQIKVEK